MNKHLLIGAVCLTASVMADSGAAAQNSFSPVVQQPVTVQPIVLPPARPIALHGLYVFGDVLYWHADLDETDWATKELNTADPVTSKQKNYRLDFKWDWAFRVGAGYNTRYDDWDFRTYYTWFQTENSQAAGLKKGVSQSIVDINSRLAGFGQGPFTQGKMNWTLHYSMIDVDLGRWFYISQAIQLRPHLGLKGGEINQKINRSFIWNDKAKFSTSKSHAKNDFWGYGLTLGFDTNWNLGHVGSHYFSLFGDLMGAFMRGYFDLSYHEKTYGLDGSLQKGFHPTQMSRKLGVPVFQAMLGFGWDTTFNDDRCSVALKLGYEFQYWFKQLHRITNETFVGANFGRYPLFEKVLGDLAFQGLTLDCRFDF